MGFQKFCENLATKLDQHLLDFVDSNTASTLLLRQNSETYLHALNVVPINDYLHFWHTFVVRICMARLLCDLHLMSFKESTHDQN